MLPGATCPASQPQSQLPTSDRECGVQRNGRRGTLHTWHHAQPTSTRPHHGSDRGQSAHRRQHSLGGAQEKHPSQDVTGVRRRARPAWDVSGGALAVLRGCAGAGVCRAWGDGGGVRRMRARWGHPPWGERRCFCSQARGMRGLLRSLPAGCTPHRCRCLGGAGGGGADLHACRLRAPLPGLLFARALAAAASAAAAAALAAAASAATAFAAAR